MTKQTYTVTVDYSKSVTELVKEGKYDWANDSITTSNFPSKEKGSKRVEITLFKFKENITSKEVVKKMKAKGYRPATIKELLTLGVNKPDLQRGNWIVALGSKWLGSFGDVHVPNLGGAESDRTLCLPWWRGGWNSDWQFACVQVSSTLKPSNSKSLEPSDTLTLSDIDVKINNAYEVLFSETQIINKKLDKVIKFFSMTKNDHDEK